jgi:predicted dehydrogenase
LDDDRVEAVVIATPPSTHAPLAMQALAAERHVFCEKPVALTDADADRVRAAVVSSSRTFVVDHVLRYNPVLAALRRLHDDSLLGAVQRLAFENDAADEDLPAGHWFWDETVSGGILLEHGVHFFDAAAMLINEPPQRVQAIGSARPGGGPIDTVVCTVAHAGGALASYAHGFSHPRRAERQLMRLDFGLAEARLHGWIPLRADLDAWADDAAADRFERLPGRAAELLTVAGVRPSGREQITVSVTRDAAPAQTSARGRPRCAPHHVRARIQLGNADAKHRVYRDSVRAALLDLAVCARTGSTPRADIEAGRAAVHVAAAGTRALRDGCTHRLSNEEATCAAD